MNRNILIAIASLLAIGAHLVLAYVFSAPPIWRNIPLLSVIVLGGGMLLKELLTGLLKGQFGSDLLAGISIVTALILGEYLAGTLVVLMLSGGTALESFAIARASSVLAALAKRMPQLAHRESEGRVIELPVDQVQIGDKIVVFPHEICPVDGVVKTGHSVMDEAFLTGEPFRISKIPGSTVISGAINGESALTIVASKKAADSRYASIMRVMQDSEQRRPRLRRLGDQLGAVYTPIALLIGFAAWALSGEARRFLAVMVIATPCPLLIAIPVAIIGTISLSAKRGIIIRNPAALEQIDACTTIIFDKTGTLTYGKPEVTKIVCGEGFNEEQVLKLAASVEQYSKHPLSRAVLDHALQRQIAWGMADEISEKPGEGLTAFVKGSEIRITGRARMVRDHHPEADKLPSAGSGLECVVLIDNRFAALFTFHDAPRKDSKPFITHLSRQHPFDSVMLLSGDRESEVSYFAERVGIKQIYSSKTPEEKLEIVLRETGLKKTVYIGDGINDAPALNIATVGIALGQNNEATSEAAGVVIMEPSLEKLDEFFHIGARMKGIALQSAVGGMLLSVVGMLIASGGMLTPVAGAVAQEIIDLAAVLNALRAAYPPRNLTDFHLYS